MYGITIYAVFVFRNTRSQVDGSAGMRRSLVSLDSALVGRVQRVLLFPWSYALHCPWTHLMLLMLQRRVHGYRGWLGSWFSAQSPPSVSASILVERRITHCKSCDSLPGHYGSIAREFWLDESRSEADRVRAPTGKDVQVQRCPWC